MSNQQLIASFWLELLYSKEKSGKVSRKRTDSLWKLQPNDLGLSIQELLVRAGSSTLKEPPTSTGPMSEKPVDAGTPISDDDVKDNAETTLVDVTTESLAAVSARPRRSIAGNVVVVVRMNLENEVEDSISLAKIWKNIQAKFP